MTCDELSQRIFSSSIVLWIRLYIMLIFLLLPTIFEVKNLIMDIILNDIK